MQKTLLIFLFLPFLSFSQDTLQMDQVRADNLLKTEHQFTGVAEVVPVTLIEYDAFQLYTTITPKYYYYNFEEGIFLYKDEVQYFCDSLKINFDQPFYSKLNSHDIEGKFYEKCFYTIDTLQYLSKTEVKNDTLITYLVNYDRKGKLLSHGHYYNETEQGDWPTYRYNDSILFTEVWTMGFLTSIKSDRTIFIGAKNKIISQEEYFEIIKSQEGIEWIVFALPAEKLDNENKVAFLMYSERLDFDGLMNKKWEEFKFIDILLKRNKKYLKKQSNE
jgi:hypothetical protein